MAGVRDGATIKILDETRRVLRRLKIQLNKRSYDEVIRFLIENYRQKKIEV